MRADPAHGVVHELLGIARDAGEWSFAAGRVELAGDSIATGPRLEALLSAHHPEVLRLLPEPDTDAIWVRARIEAMFGTRSPPEDQRVEKSLMEFGFVAKRERSGAEVAIPFVCSDYYGSSALSFARAVPALDQDAIGDAFWGLIASGRKLADYRDRAYHVGAGVWMAYGCTNGSLFIEYPEEDEAPPAIDPDEALAAARDFLDRLGPDLAGTACVWASCENATVRASLFCRWHHFEAVTGRSCPIRPS
jgi:hypothetical protein